MTENKAYVTIQGKMIKIDTSNAACAPFKHDDIVIFEGKKLTMLGKVLQASSRFVTKKTWVLGDVTGQISFVSDLRMVTRAQ